MTSANEQKVEVK